MATITDELVGLFVGFEEFRPALIASFSEVTESEGRSQVELGRWLRATKLGCDIRILYPDVDLPISDGLWTSRLGALGAARAAGNWGEVSQVAYELKLLAPDRADELALDDDAFACLDFGLPSVYDYASAFLTRAYELAVLFPGRRGEISAYDEYLPTLFAAVERLPAPNYMDYPWLVAKLRVLYPDAALTLDEHHTRSAARDFSIDRDIARRGGSPMGLASKAAPLKLLAAREIQLTDRGPVAVLP